MHTAGVDDAASAFRARPHGDTGPTYRRLYERIRSAILTGQLTGGAKLPPSRVLAREAGVSRNTVLAAFQQLHAEGYVEGKRGSGTYVAQVLPEDTLSSTPRAAPARAARRSRLLSERGTRLCAAARMPLPAVVGTPAHRPAFQIGLPALDAFPMDLWARCVARRLRRSRQRLLRYNDPAGYRPLREAIAAYLGTARGVTCTADHVVIVAGSQQALELCARLLLDPGDSAWIEDPGYLGARSALISAGARLVPVPVDENGLDVAAGVARAPDARLAFVTPSHQFPLGSTMSLERRLGLIEWARQADAWVIEDDYDGEFRYTGRQLTALQGIDANGHVLYVGTFSKVLFPALRLGYLVVPTDLIEPFAAAHLATDVHTHVLEQAALADFIEDGHFLRHLRRMRVLYQERQEVLVKAAADTFADRLVVQPSNNGLHLTGILPPGTDDTTVADAAGRQQVHAWPLSLHALEARTRPALLLGYAGATPQQILDGVQRLAAVLQ